VGLAHTDIKVNNVFVEDGVAFLDDLEYLSDVRGPPRQDDPQMLSWEEQPKTAGEQDMLQFEKFVHDINRVY
jgi:hypothetical protein